jgi:hypothetical protein
MEKRPMGAGYEAWFKAIKAKYPDAYGRTTGEYGWSSLGFNNNGPTLTPHMSGPHYTDVSSRAYSSQYLVGSYDHTSDKGRLFVCLETGKSLSR